MRAGRTQPTCGSCLVMDLVLRVHHASQVLIATAFLHSGYIHDRGVPVSPLGSLAPLQA